MWEQLTEPQATLISGGLTFFGAIGGVLLAWTLFSSKVRDLRGALQESQNLLNEHRDTVSATLIGINVQLSSLDAQVSSTLESLGRIGGTVDDIESAQSSVEAPGPELNRRDEMRAKWSGVRDHLESLAARPDIDGRTRAKYGRIDRRNYGSLIDSMEWDDNLGPHAASFRSAVELWHRFRNGRNTPTPEELAAMDYLRGQILGVAAQA
jgi:hypothetical protein